MKREMMSEFRYLGAALLLTANLTAVTNALAQSQTSTVQHLEPDTAKQVTGRIRMLRCRGKPGIDLKIHQAPSPRNPRLVTMVLRYGQAKRTRSLEQVGMGTVDHGETIEIVPGSCSWSVAGDNTIPGEPGVVYFDLPPDGQLGARPGTRDMTVDAAETWPDPTNLPQYLSNPDRWWLFYVDDVTDVSISFGAMREYRPPNFVTATGGSLDDASTTRSGATGTTADMPSSTGSAPGTTREEGARQATVPGVVTTKPVPSGSSAPGTSSGPRSPGNSTAAIVRIVRPPLQFEGVDTVLGGFTVRFSARAKASPTLLYSTEPPVRENGDWVFPGGRGATGDYGVRRPDGSNLVLPGSPAVVAGTQAQVVRQSTQAYRAQFTATSLPNTVGRGEVYHYIITVPASDDGDREQHVGQVSTVSQTVRTTITSFTILKSSFYAKDLKYDFVTWTDVGGGGPFDLCQGATCANTGDYLRLLVFATPPQKSGSVFTTPGWNAQPSAIMGIARREFDLRTIPESRPVQPFTLRAQSGEIEFEVQGTLEVIRR